MRIIGNIEHPQMKITVFKMDNRISVKFENALYEQTYKLGEDERFGSPEAVRTLVDEAFLEHVSEQFRRMHRNRMAALTRLFPPGESAVFEEII